MRFSSRRLQIILFSSIATVTLVIIVVVAFFMKLDGEIRERFSQKRFAPPVEFYSSTKQFRTGEKTSEADLRRLFEQRKFKERPVFERAQNIRGGDFSFWSTTDCEAFLNFLPKTEPLGGCVFFRNNKSVSDETWVSQSVQSLVWNETGQILYTLAGEPAATTSFAKLEPVLVAQYYGESPVLRQVVPLGETPAYCLRGLIAIEDSGFLEHRGVSLTSVARAFVANLKSGRIAQGGSTLTQQLVKNYFLSEERTLKRKLKEFAMALLVELRIGKEDILETYTNLIYMGQRGPFQIRGFASASDYYFGESLQSLDLHQCALLAAIVNSPGLFNPFTKPENAIKRRQKVLDRMLDLKFISTEEHTVASTAPLPKTPGQTLPDPAPFYIQAARKKIASEGIDSEEGLRIFLGIESHHQEIATQSLLQGLAKLDERPAIAKLKAAGKQLEGVVLTLDVATAQVTSIAAGRQYQASPFHRAIDGHRQVGSTMKPIVYLAALESALRDGSPINPLSTIEDSPWTHRFGNQAWSPKNYDGKFHGKIPLYYGLKESLNVPAGKVALEAGLENVVDLARRLGISSPLNPYPSIALGAFEIHPMELLQAYGDIARLGYHRPINYVLRIEKLNGELLWSANPENTQEEPSAGMQVVSPDRVAVLIGMLKQTLQTGTGRAAAQLAASTHAAGKTGTTNDKKDAWFVGFNSNYVVLIWVGYDDNTPHELTGASGALPIWISVFQKLTGGTGPDFPEVEGTEKVTVPGFDGSEPLELVFIKGTAPK